MRYEDKWKYELDCLYSILRKSGLDTRLKWGADVFVYNGKNVVSLAGFKNYFCIWFFNGVFLEDPYKLLVNAQEGKTKALRQWRFSSAEEIDEKIILEYVKEAIQNEIDGKVWKPEKSTRIEPPKLFEEKLNSDSELNKAFRKLTPFKQKEYLEYITSAKQDKTKVSRIDKIIPMIIEGIGLNDKYQKC